MISAGATYEQCVLFVHGIGSQKQGDTLVRWSDALTGWLVEWGSRGEETTAVRLSDVVLHSADGAPAHADLHIGFADDRVTWLLEEVWWADEVQTPSYSRLASFTIKALPMAVLGYVGGAFRRNRRWAKGNTPLQWLGHWVMAILALVLGLPLALLATPVLALLIGLMLLVGLIPVPAVRSRVQAAQRVLTLTIGDSMILLSSPTQRGAMTSRVVQAIRFAQARGCQQITIVAHSQGAAIVQRALAEHPTFLPQPHLITVGSGINRLFELDRLGKWGAWAAPAFLGGLALSVAWLWAVVATTEATILEAVAWSLGYAGVIALGGALQWANRRLGQRDESRGEASEVGPDPSRKRRSSRTSPIRKLGRRALEAAPPTILVVALLGYSAAALGQSEQLLLPVVLIVATLTLGLYATHQLAFRSHPQVEPHLKDKVVSWLDVYSHLDPVPGGPTRTAHEAWPVSIEVRNTGSTVFDHVRYEREIDDALALIAQRITRQSDGPLTVPEADVSIERRRALRQKRVTALRVTRWLPLLLAGVFAARHTGNVEAWGSQAYDEVRDRVGLPGWMPQTLSGGWDLTVGAVLTYAGAVLAYLLLARLWSAWNNAEAKAVFDPNPGAPTGSTLPILFVAGWLGLFVVAFVDDAGRLLPRDSFVDWVDDAIPFLVFFGAVAYGIFRCWDWYYRRAGLPSGLNQPLLAPVDLSEGRSRRRIRRRPSEPQTEVDGSHADSTTGMAAGAYR